MKILLYTDNHFCSYSSIVRSRGEKFSTRLENGIQSMNWVEELAIKENCQLEICLGDFFDKEILNSEELSALKEIKWNSIPKYFLVGNHEISRGDLSYNSLNALSKIGKIIDSPTMIDGYGVELIFLPYILESSRLPLNDYINTIYKKYYQDTLTTQEVKNRIILSHNDIRGIRYGAYESKQGFSVEEIENSCNLFLNGHLHNKYRISDKIYLLGNLTGLNFSEDAFKYTHCAYILDTDTLQIKDIENPYAFNFYKIIIDKDTPIQSISIKSNAVISARCYSSIAPILKQNLDNTPGLINYKISIMPEMMIRKESTENIFQHKDYIQQFKEEVINHLGSGELVLSELSLL